MRDPQSKPTIIDENGEHVDTGTGRVRGGQSANPFGGSATGLPPFPEHLLNKHGKPSLLKLIGWKGAVVLALVVAGIIALAAVSFMVVLFALPVVLLLLVVGWVAQKVRGPGRPTASNPVIVVRRPGR